MSTLVSLARIILEGAEKIEADCAARGEVYPNLNSPYNVQTTFTQNRCAAEATTVIAAATQLAATLSHPYPHILRCSMAVSPLDTHISRLCDQHPYAISPISAQPLPRLMRDACQTYYEKLVLV